MDLQVGGSSKFNVSKSGNINSGSTDFVIGSTARTFISTVFYLGTSLSSNWFYATPGTLANRSDTNFGWSSSASDTDVALDTILTRKAAANLRFGAADAAAPVGQTLGVQGVVAGTSNTAGANLTIQGSQSTGTGAGGSIIFQVAPAGTAANGTVQNALDTALTINSTKNAIFGGNVQIGSNGSGIVFSDGTRQNTAASVASGFSNMQVFTANGTFTVPAGVTKVKATVVGGGGGAAGGGGGSGGGGGGAAIKIVSGLTPANTVTVTVGTGGAGATGAGGSGGTGNTSSFGAHCSATGGVGGVAFAAGTLGGLGSSGDLNIRGGSGSTYFENSAPASVGGFGGSTILGGGAPHQTYGSGVGVAGGAYGGGGGGGGSGGAAGAGAAGVVIVEY
jgi:hypothetical protein